MNDSRACMSGFVSEPGNRWVSCRMGVELLVSATGHPILIKKGSTVLPELALRLAEWASGLWLKYDGRWGELGVFQARAVVLSKSCQPDTRITYVSPRETYGSLEVLDSMHNDGSLTLVDEAESQMACWLLATDHDCETDLLYAWTHHEWDLAGEQPGAWARSNGIWCYRKKMQPKSVPGTISVSAVNATFAVL